MSKRRRRALEIYQAAAEYMELRGNAWEIEWQRSVSLSSFTEGELLREAAWVILCCGFKESTVRRIFDHVSLCFCDWESSEAITQHATACVRTAGAVFNNPRKLDAIARVAAITQARGFRNIQREVIRNPIAELQRFPFIGPITAWHLAKNLGLDAAKPDRHLTALTIQLGFTTPHEMCDCIAQTTGERASVVDLVLWRYLAENAYTH